MAMRNPVRVFVLLCALLGASLAGAQAQPRTWRLDFYETGGPGIEAYSFDRLVVEPLAWPDNPAANVDARLTGNYRFEIVANGRVIFARGYDPAFAGALNAPLHVIARAPAMTPATSATATGVHFGNRRCDRVSVVPGAVAAAPGSVVGTVERDSRLKARSRAD